MSVLRESQDRIGARGDERTKAQWMQLLDDCIDGSIASVESKRKLLDRAFRSPVPEPAPTSREDTVRKQMDLFRGFTRATLQSGLIRVREQIELYQAQAEAIERLIKEKEFE